jgi:DNA ligase-1
MSLPAAIKPMLAAKAPDTFKFPLIASPKLDGIRCIVVGGIAMSRNWKPIPNRHVQKLLGTGKFDGFDGELGVGDPGAPDFYRVTMSAVMSEDGEPDFQYWIFDNLNQKTLGFKQRVASLIKLQSDGALPYPGVLVEQTMISTQNELDTYERQCLGQGFEGLICRSVNGAYKHGRSTTSEGGMIKLKRFSDAEAEITGFEELLKNGNQATTDAFGHTERSSHKEGMIPQDMLGALIVKNCEGGAVFNIGSGFDIATRKALWADRKNLIGKIVKYKFFDGGNKDAPRFPIYLGFRDRSDM